MTVADVNAADVNAAVVRVGRRGVLALLVGIMSGCATVAPPEPAASAISESLFELSGRFAIRAGDQNASGRIFWHHATETDDLSILSPLGQGVAQIVREKGVYTLTTAQNMSASATDPDDLTERVLGWRLPMNGLPFWVRGRAQPGSAGQTRLDDQSRLAELRQDGWTIEYLSYHADSGLPERLRVSRDKVDLRLMVEEWKRR